MVFKPGKELWDMVYWDVTPCIVRRELEVSEKHAAFICRVEE
jgi:hypothetical protein